MKPPDHIYRRNLEVRGSSVLLPAFPALGWGRNDQTPHSGPGLGALMQVKLHLDSSEGTTYGLHKRALDESIAVCDMSG